MPYVVVVAYIIIYLISNNDWLNWTQFHALGPTQLYFHEVYSHLPHTKMRIFMMSSPELVIERRWEVKDLHDSYPRNILLYYYNMAPPCHIPTFISPKPHSPKHNLVKGKSNFKCSIFHPLQGRGNYCLTLTYLSKVLTWLTDLLLRG